MSSTIKQNRSRAFIGQRNYEYETHQLNEDGTLTPIENAPTQEQWKEKVIDELFKTEKLAGSDFTEGFSFLALIFHDRDVDTNDKEHHKIKGLHCHFVIRFKNPRSYEEIKTLTNCQERNFAKLTSQGAALRYLTHTTSQAMAEEKTRYNVSELLVIDNTGNKPNQFLEGEDLETWYRTKIKANIKANEADSKSSSRMTQLAMLVSRGEIKPHEVEGILIKEFGEELGFSIYRKERKKLVEDYQDFLERKRREIFANGKKLSTIYIDGASETGKSMFAKDLANEINLRKGFDVTDTYLASSPKKNSTWDWISKYKEEHVTIFNDLDPKLFTFTEFLKTFETRIVTDVSSRYKDKTWFSEYAIITKSTPISDFIDTVCLEELVRASSMEQSQNIRYQVKRRFKLTILIENNKITLSQFSKNGYSQIKKIFNYKNITEFWEGEIRKEIINECLALLDDEQTEQSEPTPKEATKVQTKLNLFNITDEEFFKSLEEESLMSDVNDVDLFEES